MTDDPNIGVGLLPDINLFRNPSDEMVEWCARAIEAELTAEEGWMVNTPALTNMCRDHARACLAAAVGGE